MASYRSSYRRSSSRSYGRKGSSFKSKFSPKSVRQGRDTAVQTCKTTFDFVLSSGRDSSVKVSSVYGWINVWTALAGSEYGPILSKLYDEVRLDGVKFDYVFKSADGLVSTNPSYIVSFAWDRNGISSTETISAPNGDLYPKAEPKDYSSVVQRNGNFYQGFKYSTGVTASSMAEKSQFVPASALATRPGGVMNEMGEYLGYKTGFYRNGGSYCFRPTHLVMLQVPTATITGATFQVTITFNLTCRGVRMLATGPLTSVVGSTALPSDVRFGKDFYTGSGNLETGTLVTLSPGQIVVGALGGDIQIGTPGVFYDGSTVLHYQDSPEDPLTFNISHYLVGNNTYLNSSVTHQIFYYAFDSMLGEYRPVSRFMDPVLVFAKYIINGEIVYALWCYSPQTVEAEVPRSLFNLEMNNQTYSCEYGMRNAFYGFKPSPEDVFASSVVIPYLEGGIPLPFTTIKPPLHPGSCKLLLIFNDHIVPPLDEPIVPPPED